MSIGLRNTSERYGLGAVGLHWVIGILMIAVLVIGLLLEEFENSPLRFQMFGLHKSLGITVLGLAVLRVLWRGANVSPEGLPTHKPWEKILAKAAHVALYATMFALPLSGWAMSSAAGRPVSVFGLFTLPDLLGVDKELAHDIKEAHEVIANILIALLVLHVGGALKHAIVDRDSTVRRMLPWCLAAVMAVSVVGFAGPARAGDTAPPSWSIDPGRSSLTFSVTENKAPVSGAFARFRGEIAFDPEPAEGRGHVRIEVDAASVSMQDEERDAAIVGAEWFDVAAFPTAVFEADRFRRDGAGWVAQGTLTVKGASHPLDLPFTLSVDDQGVATAKGTVTLDRLDYAIGRGQWADETVIGRAVTVSFVVTARRS